MSGRMPDWMANWLSLPAGGDGTTWQLDSRWTWAPWATLVLAALAIAWTVALYRREQSHANWAYRGLLVGLRLTALATLLVMLAQLAIAIRLIGRPAIALVVDRSASMDIVDHDDSHPDGPANESSRLDLARFWLSRNDDRLIKELQWRYRLETYLVDDQVVRIVNDESADTTSDTLTSLATRSPEQNATRLGDAIRRVLADHRGQPPAAIILLTDGETTAGVPLADAVQEARRKGVPLVSIGIGSETGPRDIDVVDVLVDDAVFVGDLVNLEVRLKASGLVGQQATVTLRRTAATPDADTSEEPSAAQERSITLPQTGEVLSLAFLDRPTTAGEWTYTVEVAARQDEVNLENNRQVRTVAVRDEKIRVLLASGRPNYEFRFLKSLLERDDSVELSTFLQDADPDFAEQDKSAIRSFPIGRDELFAYDVLLLDDLDPRLLPDSAWPPVRAFVVEKGGGAAFIAGPSALPMLYADIPDVRFLLPADFERSIRGAVSRGEQLVGQFAIQPTSLGAAIPPMQLGDTREESAEIWRQLSPQYWITECGPLKPAAQVLATVRSTDREEPSADVLPAICFQYVGAGRVLFHAIDSTWLWRRDFGETYFARYWVQSIRYLARGKLSSGRGVTLTTDRREYISGESVQVRARFLDPRLAPADEVATVAVQSPDQPRRQLALRRNPAGANVFDGTLTDLPQDGYQLLLTDPPLADNPPEARFVVVAPPGELARPEMDRAALVAAAQATRGLFFTLAEADAMLDELPPGRPVPVANLPPIAIWNRWWLISAFLACLVGEWILRKRKGML